MKLGNHPEEELAGLVKCLRSSRVEEMAALEVEELAANLSS